MSVETYMPQDSAPQHSVTVSDAAQAHFRNQLVGREGSAVRLSVKESGCTGYKYVIDIVDRPEDNDVEIALADDLRLLVSAEAMSMVRGTRIDYTREGLNRTLKFINPNVADECGCGESFSVN